MQITCSNIKLNVLLTLFGVVTTIEISTDSNIDANRYPVDWEDWRKACSVVDANECAKQALKRWPGSDNQNYCCENWFEYLCVRDQNDALCNKTDIEAAEAHNQLIVAKLQNDTCRGYRLTHSDVDCTPMPQWVDLAIAGFFLLFVMLAVGVCLKHYRDNYHRRLDLYESL